MKEGDVILTPIPQANGQIKNRPAIVLREMPPFQDLLVCGISTQLRQEVKKFDEVIVPTDTDFSSSGLLSPSLIRLAFLFVIPQKKVAGSIGKISPDRHERLLRNLGAYLVANLSPKATS